MSTNGDPTVEINGVVFTGLRRGGARFRGKCDLSGTWFDEGADILYKRRQDMTAEEQRACPGKYTFTVLVEAAEGGMPAARAGRPQARPQQGRDEYGEHRAAQQQQRRTGKPKFKPSKYQEAILAVLLALEIQRNILIRALAGSGKTETLVWLLWELLERGRLRGLTVMFLAFNRNIRDTLVRKLESTGVPAKTTHGFCFSNLLNLRREIEPNKGKSREVFLRAVVDKLGLPQNPDSFKRARQSGYWELVGPACDLAGHIKNWAICPTYHPTAGWVFTGDQEVEINHLIDYYKMDIKEERRREVLDWACTIIRVGTPAPGEPVTMIDYDDMIYLVHVLGVVVPRFDLVLTDESQDFNRAQLLLLQKLAAAGARIVAVGDENQGLYRFRGAAGKAMQWLHQMFETSERGLETCLLPINYRCARAIIRWNQQWVPELEGFREEEGVVSSDLSYEDTLNHAQNDQYRMVQDPETGMTRRQYHSYAFLCRTNAPLVITAYKLIGKKKRIHILGRDSFATPLVNLIDKLCGRDPSDDGYTDRISDRKDAQGAVIEEGLLSLLSDHLKVMRTKWEKEEHREQLETLEQHAECLQVICSQVTEDSVRAVRKEIDNLFCDKQEDGVINLATVHGAKGLEWNTVYIIRPDLLPHPSVHEFDEDGNETEEFQQEMNACYVAGTRARDELFYVLNWPFGKGMGTPRFYPEPTRDLDFDPGQYEEETWRSARDAAPEAPARSYHMPPPPSVMEGATYTPRRRQEPLYDDSCMDPYEGRGTDRPGRWGRPPAPQPPKPQTAKPPYVDDLKPF